MFLRKLSKQIKTSFSFIEFKSSVVLSRDISITSLGGESSRHLPCLSWTWFFNTFWFLKVEKQTLHRKWLNSLWFLISSFVVASKSHLSHLNIVSQESMSTWEGLTKVLFAVSLFSSNEKKTKFYRNQLFETKIIMEEIVKKDFLGKVNNDT